MGARWGLQGQEVGREDGPRAVGEGLGATGLFANQREVARRGHGGAILDLNLQGPRSVRRKCPGRLECTELSRRETGSGRVRRLRVPRGDVGGGTGRGAEAAGGGAERERGRDTPGGGGGADPVQSEGGPQSNVPNVPQRVLNWGLTCLAGDPSADRAVTRAWSQVGKVAGDRGVVESGAVARWENRLEPPAVGPKPSPTGQGPATR